MMVPVAASLPHPVLNGSDEDVDVKEPERKRLKGDFQLRSLSPFDHGTTNDEIHTRVNYCPTFKAIMDTPQVQRLRFLKQLGMADYAYMNVNHNRFEHSVGVAHLAEQLGRRLQSRQPNLKITDKDILCLKLAGLCHDLGHGPFSHVYSDLFPEELEKYLAKNPDLLKHYENLPAVPERWKHEDASLMMIDAALESLGLAVDIDNLDRPLRQIGNGVKAESMRVYKPSDDGTTFDPQDILTSRDLIFIKECILGKPIGNNLVDELHSGFLGRQYVRQEFLYDFISNRHSGLDVDKLDYFARDQRRALGSAGDIEVRLIDEAVVAWGQCPRPKVCFSCKAKGDASLHLMICYPEKIDRNAMETFHIRFRNHQAKYSHKTSMAATYMVCDVLTYADPFFRIPTHLDSDRGNKSDGPKGLPISRAMLHKTSYLRLRDSVIDLIMATNTPELEKSRLLIERLWNRDLYKCAGYKAIDKSTPRGKALSEKAVDDIKDEILMIRGKHDDDEGRPIYLEEDDFIVEKGKIHHGAGEKNPVSLMRFLPKRELRWLTRPVEDLPLARSPPDNPNGNTPMVFQEEFVRVYCRGDSDKLKLLRHVFYLWELEMDEELMITVDDSSDASHDKQQDPVTCTQESDMNSPGRGGFDSDRDLSPLPTSF